MSIQKMARRSAMVLPGFGETKSLNQWSQDPRCVVSKRTLLLRINSGMDLETALTQSAGQPTRKSTGRRKPRPPKDVPIKPHANGQWYCRHPLTGEREYLGPWQDVEGARRRYVALLQGRSARDADVWTMTDLANHYLTDLEDSKNAGEVSEQHFRDCHQALQFAIGSIGRHTPLSEDIEPHLRTFRKAVVAKYSPNRARNTLQKVRTVFRFAVLRRQLELDFEIVKDCLSSPRQLAVRRHRASKPKKFVEAEELRRLLELCQFPYRAMVLLALNGGLTQSDLSELRRTHIDGTGRWLEYPRPKSGIERRIPLWPETAEALADAIKNRPAAQDEADADRVFLTRGGQPYLRYNDRGKKSRIDAIGRHARRLFSSAGINREGVAFSSLRHVTETIGGELRDQPAVNLIMGHADPTISGHYREHVSDARLEAVTEHIRLWLWPPAAIR